MLDEHQKQWEFLKGKYQTQQLGHAYLISGPEGVGKKEFAKKFVQFVNCINEPKSCGKCINCNLIEKEQFPDLLVVKSLNSDSSQKNGKDMMEIDVAQIREVNNFLSYKSYYGNYKTVIIEDAERMNVEAQNSFLKTLEEPKGKTIIFLVSSKPNILLSTIFSRCQAINLFPKEVYRESKEDQKLLQELLVIVSAELAVKFQYTKKVNLEGNNGNIILKVLQRYFRNMLLIKIGALPQQIPPQFSHYSVEKIKKIIRLIESLHIQISQTNASPKLALEILLLEL